MHSVHSVHRGNKLLIRKSKRFYARTGSRCREGPMNTYPVTGNVPDAVSRSALTFARCWQEVIGLLGLNGDGKTTTLRVLPPESRKGVLAHVV